MSEAYECMSCGTPIPEDTDLCRRCDPDRPEGTNCKQLLSLEQIASLDENGLVLYLANLAMYTRHIPEAGLDKKFLFETAIKKTKEAGGVPSALTISITTDGPKKPAKEKDMAKAKKTNKKNKTEAVEETPRGRRASYMDSKVRATTKDLKEGSVQQVIASAFGLAKSGKKASDIIEELAMTYEPKRSKAFEADPEKYIKGYVAHMLKEGLLETV